MSTLPSLQALRKVPEVNASWNTEYIRQYHSIDISVAVQTPGGLMVPIVHDADALGLSDISAKVKDLATKVSRQSTPFLAAHICMYKQHGYAGQAADGLLMCRFCIAAASLRQADTYAEAVHHVHAGKGWQAEAAGVHWGDLLHLQSGHVRHHRILRHHQSAAGRLLV